MPSATQADTDLPGLQMLGSDLLVTTRRQRRLALVRPSLGVAAYLLAAYAGCWWLTPFLVFVVGTGAPTPPRAFPSPDRHGSALKS